MESALDLAYSNLEHAEKYQIGIIGDVSKNHMKSSNKDIVFNDFVESQKSPTFQASPRPKES